MERNIVPKNLVLNRINYFENLSTDGNDFNKKLDVMLKNYRNNDDIEEMIDLTNIKIRKISYNCDTCHLNFNDCVAYQDHLSTHLSDFIYNEICMCNRCGLVFVNDSKYVEHTNICNEHYSLNQSSSILTNIIMSDPNGQFECPTCDNKFTTQYLLGEHFMQTHNDYEVLCSLDNVVHNGFPGFDILHKIGMIKKISSIKTKNKCKVCYSSYTDIKEHNFKIIDNNKNPIKLSCCRKTVCHECLLNHVSINETLKCPLCRFDHTRIDWDYVIYIDIDDVTDSNRWIEWRNNHLID